MKRSTLKSPRNRARLPLSRRLVESSDSEESRPGRGARKVKKPLVADVIELTSSSDEETPPLMSKKIGRNQEKRSQVPLSSYLSQEDDGAVLILYVESFAGYWS
jgi:hypothetical protein